MAYKMTWTYVQEATTRSAVQKLVYDSPLPKTLRNELQTLKKVYEETFISSAGFDNEDEARSELKKIRDSHPYITDGWYCPGGSHEGVFEEGGKWYAFRHLSKRLRPGWLVSRAFAIYKKVDILSRLILKIKKYIICNRWENERIRKMQIMSNTMSNK